MRNLEHYLFVLSLEPVGGLGVALAASAVYAARRGACEDADRANPEWGAIFQDLKTRYGERLTVAQTRNEMRAAEPSAFGVLLAFFNEIAASGLLYKSNFIFRHTRFGVIRWKGRWVLYDPTPKSWPRFYDYIGILPEPERGAADGDAPTPESLERIAELARNCGATVVFGAHPQPPPRRNLWASQADAAADHVFALPRPKRSSPGAFRFSRDWKPGAFARLAED